MNERMNIVDRISIKEMPLSNSQREALKLQMLIKLYEKISKIYVSFRWK